jgi:alanyl-tRNA synthetase
MKLSGEIYRREELAVRIGDRVGIVLDKTPFFPRRGGQECDIGTLRIGSILIDVDEVIEPVEGLIVHWGTIREI